MSGIGSGIAEFFWGLIIFAVICFILAIMGGVYYLTSIFKDNHTIKSKTPPVITWELKTDGKKIDTIWIYNFKK